MNRFPHMVLAYLARIGVEARVVDGELQLCPMDLLKGNDLESIRGCKQELIDLIESGEHIVDDFPWGPSCDKDEHRERRLR